MAGNRILATITGADLTSRRNPASSYVEMVMLPGDGGPLLIVSRAGRCGLPGRPAGPSHLVRDPRPAMNVRGPGGAPVKSSGRPGLRART
jgi:hypothetical protein